MSSPSVMHPPNPYRKGSSTKQIHTHQVRMEIVLEARTAKVNVGDILQELMRRAMKGQPTTTFQDIGGQDFSLDDFIPHDTFAERLGVEQLALGTSKKVVLGSFVTTEKSFMDLKINIGLKWLQENKVFMRIQHLSFEHGTDLSLVGYYIMEHPRFGIATTIIDNILSAWSDAAFSATHDDEKRVERMTKSGILEPLEDGGKVCIPVSVERGRVKVKAPSTQKSDFTSDVWHVYVPRKHYGDATFLNDLSLLDPESLKLLIPYGMAKKNTKVFYNQLKKHSQYLHEHRNITIHNVLAQNYPRVEPVLLGRTIRDTSLQDYLESMDSIYRVYFNTDRETINVSVNMKDYEATQTLLQKSPCHFSFGPYIREQGTKKSEDKYSQAFNADSDDDGSFDPSTIASAKSRNPWTKSPPMELVFDVTDKGQFPPIPTQKNAAAAVSLTGTTSETQTTTMDLESIIANAIAAHEKKFLAHLAQVEDRQNTLEATVQQLIAKIDNEIGKMAETVANTLITKSNIFFTKEDAANMMERQNATQNQTQAQLDRILNILHAPAQSPPQAPVSSPPRKSPRTEDIPTTPTTRNAQDFDHPMPQAQHEGVGET